MTVLFDGACGLCAPVVAVLRRLDLRRRVEFLDLPRDRPAIHRRFPALSRDACLTEMHGIDRHGWSVAGRALTRPAGLSRDCRSSSRGDLRRPTVGSWLREACAILNSFEAAPRILLGYASQAIIRGPSSTARREAPGSRTPRAW